MVTLRSHIIKGAQDLILPKVCACTAHDINIMPSYFCRSVLDSSDSGYQSHDRMPGAVIQGCNWQYHWQYHGHACISVDGPWCTTD
jgi:hypothetical protein